jgi:hypothetical protein
MLNIKIAVLSTIAATMTTFIVERYGFSVAHSGALLLLALSISPGIVVMFLPGAATEPVLYILAVAITSVVYCLAYLVLHRVCRRSIKADETEQAQPSDR